MRTEFATNIHRFSREELSIYFSFKTEGHSRETSMFYDVLLISEVFFSAVLNSCYLCLAPRRLETNDGTQEEENYTF